MTTQRGRRQLPTDGRSSRIQPLPVDHALEAATAEPPPTTTTTSKPTHRWPSTACASLERHGPTSRRRRAVVDTAGDHPDPAIRAARLPAPLPRTTTIPVGHSSRWKARTPDAHTGRRRPEAGGRTLDTWTLRHPYRTPDTDQLDSHPWDTGRSHRTPTRTGRRQHSRRPDLLSLLAEGPHAGRPAVFLLSHDQAAAGSLRWPGRASAHCSPQTNFGSSVERAALGQVLWRVQQRSVLWRAERADALNGR
jgi:hypothetical protein